MKLELPTGHCTANISKTDLLWKFGVSNCSICKRHLEIFICHYEAVEPSLEIDDISPVCPYIIKKWNFWVACGSLSMSRIQVEFFGWLVVALYLKQSFLQHCGRKSWCFIWWNSIQRGAQWWFTWHSAPCPCQLHTWWVWEPKQYFALDSAQAATGHSTFWQHYNRSQSVQHISFISYGTTQRTQKVEQNRWENEVFAISFWLVLTLVPRHNSNF